MADRIVRAISTDGMVQAAAICSRDLTERARQIHKTLPVATAALGRTLAAASMMGNALKSDGARRCNSRAAVRWARCWPSATTRATCGGM